LIRLETGLGSWENWLDGRGQKEGFNVRLRTGTIGIDGVWSTTSWNRNVGLRNTRLMHGPRTKVYTVCIMCANVCKMNSQRYLRQILPNAL
jgi:hypothetical protein